VLAYDGEKNDILLNKHSESQHSSELEGWNLRLSKIRKSKPIVLGALSGFNQWSSPAQYGR